MTLIRLVKTSEKGLRPLGHRSVEWRFDLCFQQKRRRGVGWAKKITRWSTFLVGFWADASPMFQGPVGGLKNCNLLSHTRMITRLAYIRSSVPL